MKELSARERQIFSAVMASYIATAEPVGSQTISRMKHIDVSSATIRKVMSDLEDRGFLCQPHVSAGRVPTNQGLRFYVDSILEVKELDQVLKQKIDRALAAPRSHNAEEVLRAAGQALSIISKQAVVIAAAVPQEEIFRHVEFVLLQPGLILVVFVAKGGGVQNRVIEAEAEIKQNDLDKFANYLNDLLSDLTLSQVRDRVALEMTKEKVRFDRILSQALELGQKAFSGQSRASVFVEGQANLMEAPEFADVAKLRQIFRAFEEKSTLLRLVEKSMAASGVQIFIGTESNLAGLEGISSVTASYGEHPQAVGALGVIGPTRMDYSRVIPVVDYTAQLVSRILEED